MTAHVLAPGSLDGQRVLVTGAGSGIGRGIAVRIGQLGAHVIGLGRRDDPLAGTVAEVERAGGSAQAHACDVRDPDQVAELIERIGGDGGLTGLVNNAGGQFFARAEDISPRGWDAVVDLNLNAVFTMTRAAHPWLAIAGGSIVNVSLSGVERGSMGLAHSVAARSGVLGMTRTLALEWARDAIRVNCLGPGTVLTEAFLAGMTDQRIVDRLVEEATPMRRATDVAEVAELAAFLCSDAGAMITGQLLHVDGGAHLGSGLHLLPEEDA